MSTQSEHQLEQNLISRLQTLGFEQVEIGDGRGLEENLRKQLEKFNKTIFTDTEFKRILNHLRKGNRFDKAKTLRDRFNLKRDDETETSIRFFNMHKWCQNEYQVTNQIVQKERRHNRYDVTLLVNGLPLVQIELKKRGGELKEAFNQIKRYQKDSFSGTLFEYVQIFVMSNGVNTKYCANNPAQTFEQTFYWTDKKNNKITGLDQFADVYLEKCALSEMIGEYIVLAESAQIPMVLRPYQYYAVREIEKKVDEGVGNGYVWHTTGSGKTLTSFKASQIVSQKSEVAKVLFVVDRKDLDIQTTKEFNSFSDGSVDGTENTYNLVKQLKDPKRKLIVTTIQKLDRAISRQNYVDTLDFLRREKVVIIFDECHRSQFGDTHGKIKNFFENAQLFGFTGTPIFAKNHIGGVTTKDVFDTCLHKYIITHAIDDNNVLGFSVEYVGRYRKKDPDIVADSDIETDIEVPGIDSKEVLESNLRIDKISKYVLKDWKRKTKRGKFNAIFAVSNIDVLKKYYTLLNEYKDDDFKIATIFSYNPNEDRDSHSDTTGLLDEDVFPEPGMYMNPDSRDFLDECIDDYNQYFGTSFSSDKFYDYYRDLQKKVKDKQIDLLLVVNMFLTGFDSRLTNTLFVDKNLRYHGLVQAYSRTNRLLNADKPHGNIVSFRNLKKATDDALELFADENAKERVFKPPYEEQKNLFIQNLATMKMMTPTIGSVDELEGDEDKLNFVKAFRQLLRSKASLETYADFDIMELGIGEQEFADYESKYQDLYNETKKKSEKESILDDIDFEIELTLKDYINYDYIINLIASIREESTEKGKEKKKEQILKLFDRDILLKKKKELIDEFITVHLPLIQDDEDTVEAFEHYWDVKQKAYMQGIADGYNMSVEKLYDLIGTYQFTQKFPKDQALIDLLHTQPKVLERESILQKIKDSVFEFFEIFDW